MRTDARMKAIFSALIFVVGLAASAGAQPVRLTAPLEMLDTVQGSAAVRKAGQVLVVTLPSQDGHGRWFRVEAASRAALPAGFRADSAEVLSRILAAAAGAEAAVRPARSPAEVARVAP